MNKLNCVEHTIDSTGETETHSIINFLGIIQRRTNNDIQLKIYRKSIKIMIVYTTILTAAGV